MSSATPIIVAAALSLVAWAVVPLGISDAEAVTVPTPVRAEIVTPAPERAPARALSTEVSAELAPCLEATPGWEQLVVWVEVDEDGEVAGLSPGSEEELPEGAASCLIERIGAAEVGAERRSVSVVLAR